jgi:hypothetical protein
MRTAESLCFLWNRYLAYNPSLKDRCRCARVAYSRWLRPLKRTSILRKNVRFNTNKRGSALIRIREKRLRKILSTHRVPDKRTTDGVLGRTLGDNPDFGDQGASRTAPGATILVSPFHDLRTEWLKHETTIVAASSIKLATAYPAQGLEYSGPRTNQSPVAVVRPASAQSRLGFHTRRLSKP